MIVNNNKYVYFLIILKGLYGHTETWFLNTGIRKFLEHSISKNLEFSVNTRGGIFPYKLICTK
jgi:hypothetical protein